jgi:anti-anti-sigma factor
MSGEGVSPLGEAGSPPWQLRVRPHREAVHVELTGELDIAASGHARDALHELVAAGFEHLVIDLRALTFIDASGLQLLLEFHAASRRDGWRLSLIQGPPAVRRLFELTATLDALPFTPNTELEAPHNQRRGPPWNPRRQRPWQPAQRTPGEYA